MTCPLPSPSPAPSSFGEVSLNICFSREPSLTFSDWTMSLCFPLKPRPQEYLILLCYCFLISVLHLDCMFYEDTHPVLLTAAAPASSICLEHIITSTNSYGLNGLQHHISLPDGMKYFVPFNWSCPENARTECFCLSVYTSTFIVLAIHIQDPREAAPKAVTLLFHCLTVKHQSFQSTKPLQRTNVPLDFTAW